MNARRGISILEMVISLVLLGAMMTMTMQFLAWSVKTHRGAERRQFAAQELANSMEQLAALPWDELTPERAAATRISDQAHAVLEQPVLTVTIASSDSDPNTKQIAMELTWQNEAGEYGVPVRLTTWKIKP